MLMINIFIASVILWSGFIVFANTREYIKGDYIPPIQAVAHLIGIVFGIFDVVFNVTYGSIVFMQWPHWKRLTLTARLKYILHYQKMGWRWKLADKVCRRLIEPWDPNHCGLK